MDDKKERWLKRNGFEPITDDILREWSNGKAKLYEDSKSLFTHYKRFGKTLMLYNPEYLEKHSLAELKRRNRRNIMRFIGYTVDELYYWGQ